MAKTKPSQPEHQEHQPPNDSDRFTKLQDLNKMLLKQTSDGRKEIERLRASEQALHSAVERLTKQTSDRSIEDEIQRGVTKASMQEMRREIEEFQRVQAVAAADLDSKRAELEGLMRKVEGLERRNAEVGEEKSVLERKIEGLQEGIKKGEDEFKKDLERLKLQVLELEGCNTATEEELGRVRSERRKLVEEKKERERKIEILVDEKGLIEGKLTESEKTIEDLRISIENAVREKEGVECERAKLEVKATELQNELDDHRGAISKMQEREADLVNQVSEADEKLTTVQLDLALSVEEKTEVEKQIVSLKKELNFTSRDLAEALRMLTAERENFGAMVRRMGNIEKEKQGQEIEIENLRGQVEDLRNMVSTLKKSLQEQVDTNNQIQSEALRYKSAHESVTIERDDVKASFNLKEKEEERLRTVVKDLEKGIEATKDELELIRNELSKEIEEKKSCISTLTVEKGELQRKLVKVEDETKALQSEVTLSNNQNVQMLLMLKNKVEMVSRFEESDEKEEEDYTIFADKMAEFIKPLVAELKAITRAFKNEKEKKEDLNKQLASLKSQIEQAQKKNGLVRLFPFALALAGAVAGMAYSASLPFLAIKMWRNRNQIITWRR